MTTYFIMKQLKGLPSNALINTYAQQAMRFKSCATYAKVSGVFALVSAGATFSLKYVPESKKRNHPNAMKLTSELGIELTVLLLISTVMSMALCGNAFLQQKCIIDLLKGRGVTPLPT